MGNGNLLYTKSEIAGNPMRLYMGIDPELEKELACVLKENPRMDQLKALTFTIDRLRPNETEENEDDRRDSFS